MTDDIQTEFNLDAVNTETVATPPESSFRQDLEIEKNGLGYLVADLKQLTEAIEKRFALIRFVHDEEFRSNPKFEEIPEKDRKKIFKSVYGLDRDQVKPIVEEFKIAEDKLQSILRRLK